MFEFHLWIKCFICVLSRFIMCTGGNALYVQKKYFVSGEFFFSVVKKCYPWRKGFIPGKKISEKKKVLFCRGIFYKWRKCFICEVLSTEKIKFYAANMFCYNYDSFPLTICLMGISCNEILFRGYIILYRGNEISFLYISFSSNVLFTVSVLFNYVYTVKATNTTRIVFFFFFFWGGGVLIPWRS